MQIDRNTKLKDIDLNIDPVCPKQFLHRNGTVGIICDRAGFKYIVTPPCLKSVLYLYDINIRTFSCGANYYNTLGIYCDYDALNEENRCIVDNYLTKHNLEVVEAEPMHHSERTFRIEVEVDFEKDSIATAEQKLYKEVLSLGLVKQDVMYGFNSKQKEIDYVIQDTAKHVMRWNGKELAPTITPTMNEQQAEEHLLKTGNIIENDRVWFSNELYQKHLDYIKEQNVEDGFKK